MRGQAIQFVKGTEKSDFSNVKSPSSPSHTLTQNKTFVAKTSEPYAAAEAPYMQTLWMESRVPTVVGPSSFVFSKVVADISSEGHRLALTGTLASHLSHQDPAETQPQPAG